MSEKIGTHAYTKGPCYGVKPGEDKPRWFPTRTACKKAGYRVKESLMAGGNASAQVEETVEDEAA